MTAPKQPSTLLTKCETGVRSKGIYSRRQGVWWCIFFLLAAASSHAQIPRPTSETDRPMIQGMDRLMRLMYSSFSDAELGHLKQAARLSYACTFDTAGHMMTIRLTRQFGAKPIPARLDLRLRSMAQQCVTLYLPKRYKTVKTAAMRQTTLEFGNAVFVRKNRWIPSEL